MSVLGAIEIQMLADVARLRQDMSDAKGIVGDASAQMQRAADGLKTAFAGIAAGLTVGAFVSMVKGAIDAAEALHDMAIQTGVSVENLSAFQAIGRTTGTSAETIAGAMNKLAKNMAVSNEESKGAAQAIKALGLDFETFRRMKPDDQMLALAKAIGQFEDGGGKSAAAMTLMGKEGAKLLPFMTDLAAAGQLVATTTTEQAEMADKYNDALEASAMRTDAFKRELALGLLPTLIEVHDMTRQFAAALGDYLAAGAHEAGGELGAMRATIAVLGTVMETLIVLASDVAFVFKGIGTEIGGIAAQVVAFLSGNFAQAGEIGRQMTADAAQRRAELDKFQASILGVTDRTLQARDALQQHSLGAKENSAEMARLTARTGEAKKGQLDFSTATDKAAESTKKHAEEIRKLFEKLGTLIAAQQLELAQGEKLTAGQKQALDLMVQLRDGSLRLTQAEATRLGQQLTIILAQEKHIATQQEEAKLQAEILKDREAMIASLQKETGSIGDQVERQREQNLELKLGEQAYGALTIQRLRDLAAQKEAIATTSEQSAELREQARLLRERADLAEQGIVLKEAKAAADEWKKTTDSIGQGLTDSLFRAFESGKDFFSTFWQGIKNLFKTTVLKLLIQPVQGAINGLVGSVLGGLGGSATAGTGAAGGGIGDMLGLGGVLGSFAGGGGLLGFAGDVFGSAIGAGTSGVGALSGLAGSIGSAIAAVPVWGWIAGGLALLAKSLDDSGTPHIGGSATADRFGAGIAANDGWFNQQRDPKADTFMLEASKGIASILNALGGVAGGGNFAVTTAYADDSSRDPGQGQFRVKRDNQTLIDWGSNWSRLFTDGEAGMKEYLAAIAVSTRDAIDSIGLPEWAQKTFDALGGAPTLEQLSAAAQQIAATQTALGQFADQVGPLGGVFARVAGLSGDATLQLAGFAGGMDALIAKTRSYVDAYYSEAEKAGLQAVAIKQALEAAGLGTGISTKDDLRALVDSRDVASEEGRKQLAALLDVASSFAGLTDYLAKTGLSLGDVAASAPQVALLDQATQQADRLVAVNDSIMTIGEQITGAIASAQASSEAGTAQVALNTATLTRLIQRFDDGDALLVRVAA